MVGQGLHRVEQGYQSAPAILRPLPVPSARGWRVLVAATDLLNSESPLCQGGCPSKLHVAFQVRNELL